MEPELIRKIATIEREWMNANYAVGRYPDKPRYCGINKKPGEVVVCACMGCINGELRSIGVGREDYKKYLEITATQ